MRSILFFLAVLMLGTTANSQPFDVGAPIKVLDFNHLYSNYAWDETTKKAIYEEFGEMVNDVVKQSNEAGWPVGIASLDARTRNRALMHDYTLFFMAMLNEHVAILFAPKIENSNMPEDMRPAEDMFFIVLVNAIEEQSLYPPDISTEGFAAQMEEITKDFKNGFANVVNQILHQDLDALTVHYGTMVPIDGADEIYYIEDLMAASTILQAGFPGHTDPANGLITYYELVRKVEALKLTCCPVLVKEVEGEKGNRRRQIFKTHDPNGKLDAAYQNMVIEVGLELGETFDNEGQILDFWIPMLYIYTL